MDRMARELEEISTMRTTLMLQHSRWQSNICVDLLMHDTTMSKDILKCTILLYLLIFSECFAQYAGVSHNVLKQERFARHRASRSARGAMDIAVALSKLPTSSHMRDTFIVDVFLQSNDLLGFTVQGLFCDGDLTQTPSPSFFSRSFLVSPRENEWVTLLYLKLILMIFVFSAQLQ